MSFQQSGLGTNNRTYSHNWDRNGGWASYLQSLSLQNNHDRQKVNGQVNVKTGMVDIDALNRRSAVTSGVAGEPLPPKRVGYQNFKISVPDNKEKLAKMKKQGKNPNYNICPGS